MLAQSTIPVFIRLAQAFEIIERLQAFLAAVKCFAGGGAKAAQHNGMFGAALWARYDWLSAEQSFGAGEWFYGRRNAVGQEFLFACCGKPIRGPGRLQHQIYFYGLIPCLFQSIFDV